MPDLVALRERALDLIARKAAVREATHAICSARIVLTRPMLDHVTRELDEEGEGADDPETVFRHDVGEAMPLFTDGALHAIIGGLPAGNYRRSTFVGNARMTMAEVIRCGNAVPDITAGDEPDLRGHTAFEIKALVDAYRAAIEDMTEDLRDTHTRIAGMRRLRSFLPAYVKGACIGMFGGSDASRFAYTEGDFARSNTVAEAIPPGDTAFREGGRNERRVDLHPPVFSARYLAPFLGDEAALRVEAAFAAIEAASAPRLGEPPVLRSFSSNATNRIRVEYAPGEVELDPASGPGPRP